MEPLNVALVSVGGLTLVLSLVAGLLRNEVYLISEPMLAVLLGVLIGPAGLDLVVVSEWGDPFTIVEQVARLTVGLAVVAAALRLPRGYFSNHYKTMAWVLLPGMVGMWLVASLLVALPTGTSLTVALLVGAIVTPTDPVLAGTIVTGSAAEENIPGRLRNLLTAESGANDGLAYPFVFLPLLLIEHAPERVLSEWLVGPVLWEVGGAVLIGAVVGAVTGLVERESRERAYLEETSVLTVTVALTAAVLGGVKLLESDGILAAFVAGLLFNRFADAGDEAEEQKVQETVLRLFTFPVFFLFGATIPWEAWIALGWTGVAVAVGVLLLRRLPMVAVFYWAADEIENGRGAAFGGWFGPIGIAALFYATVAHRLTGSEFVWAAATLVLASSIVVHGATATPLTKLFGPLRD